MTSAPWLRRSGVLLSSDPSADRARALLQDAGVVALLESEPEAPDTLGFTVAVDEAGRVAAVGETGEIGPGPLLSELAEQLAEDGGGRVVVDGVDTGPEPEDADDDSDPFDPEIDVVAAYVPDRAVVFTRAPAEELGTLADAAGTAVLAAPHLDGHLVLVSDGQTLSAADWPDPLQPALVLEQGAAYPAVAVVEGGAVHLHTWDTELEVLPRGDEEPSAAVAAFADSTLGTGALVGSIMKLLPSIEPVALRAAIEGERGGPSALVSALALPRELVGYLGHGDDVPPLDGARTHEPTRASQVWARAVSGAMTDAQAQMSESVREQTELVRERAERVRVRAEAARVRAESAFDAAETFTEEVVVPIRQSWWTPAVAVAEATAGGLALYRASRGLRTGSRTTAGQRVLAVAGVLLLVDAVVNAAVFLDSRLRRDL